MYFAYGCPKVLCLRPDLIPGERILAVSFNPPGSLLAIASTSRVCIWSGGKDHFPLSALPVELRGLTGICLLWKRDSSVLAAVSSSGQLVLLSVKPKPGARPTSERFALPDWFEPQRRHATSAAVTAGTQSSMAVSNLHEHTRVPTETDGGECDAWADPGEADMAVISIVEAIGSEVSAICLGRFGQHVLVGTESGAIYGVSWEGQILCCYDIIAVPGAPPRVGGVPGPGLSDDRTRSADLGVISSLSFNDTLQLLALTTEDGSFFMGTLSKNSCWLRNIAVTERGQGHAKTEAMSTAVPAVTASSDHEPKRDHSDLDAKQISRGWGWRLLGTGRHAVAAAATAAATDALSASTSAPSSLSGRRNGLKGIIEASPPVAADAVTGAMCVEFSPKGLMAVGIVDGTVLLTRVERYTTGLRSRHKLHISNNMLHKSDSYKLETNLAKETGLEGVGVPGETDPKDARPPPSPSLGREGSMSSLWGVEVHHLYCLSLSSLFGPGGPRGEAQGSAGRVLSMCFSTDGWALAVGHERALTVWSTEDGTRLVCTTSKNSDTGDRGSGEGFSKTVHANAVATAAAAAAAAASPSSGAAAKENSNVGARVADAEQPPQSRHPAAQPSSRAASGGMLDLVAGGARALTWGSEGYRLVSVGAEVGGTGSVQGIVAFDFFRRARSDLASALLALQGSDRIALVDSQPWSAQVLLWRVLPVHPGYLAANAPLRHVSTSRAGTHVAVAGARGLAVYSRPTNRWRLFGNIHEEQEVEVAGMCWWGESAIMVASRVKHAFILLLYPRNHLTTEAMLLPPIKLPVGMRPLFMQGTQESGSKPGTKVFFLLVAGYTSYLLYRFSCNGALESGNVTFGVLHEGSLPHVLGNMGDRHPLGQSSTLPVTATPPPSGEPDQIPLGGGASADDRSSKAAPPEPSGATSASDGAAQRRTQPGLDGSTDNDNDHRKGGYSQAFSMVPSRPSTSSTGPPGSRVAVINGDNAWRKHERFFGGQRGSSPGCQPSELPAMIGPPKRVMLLPEVHPRTLALLDYDGNLVTMDTSNGEVKAVADGVESVIDLSEVSEAWEVGESPLLVHPCYLLRTKGRVGGGGAGGGGGDGDGGGEMAQEFSVWCPAMRLDPCPPSVQRLLTPGREPSPVFSLEPGTSCDPEQVDLGLQPLLGTMVLASQVVCPPRLLSTPPLPPCYELRTHLRPVLHMVLRHLLIASQFQLVDSPSILSPSRPGANRLLGSPGTAGGPGGGDDAVAVALGGAAPGASERAGVTPGDGSFNDGGSGDGGVSERPRGVVQADDPQATPSRGTGNPLADEGPLGGRQRDWHGTNSDAFEIAVAVLKRCREDGVLVEALPETLELLLRTCMEALHVAGDRAKAQAVAARINRVKNPKVDVNGVGGNSGGASSSPGSPPLAVSELELARAVMTDSMYLAQLAPECFHEVVARVARKTEPERYGLMFPLHRTVDEDDQHGASTAGTRAHLEGPQGNGVRRGSGAGCSGGGSGKTSGVVGLGLSWGRLVHPTHLFHECVIAGRLTTAAWFLPLVRDDVAYDAARRHAGPDGPLSEEERRRYMPPEMWAMTGKDWSFGLSHALSCVLLSASLSSNQHAFLPEVWLFARKREQSAPHHHYHHGGPQRVEKAGEPDEGVFEPPWYRRGQGAAIEAAQATELKKSGSRSVSALAGVVVDPGEALVSPVPESALTCGEDTHFGRTSRLRLRALRRLGSGGGGSLKEERGDGDRAGTGSHSEAVAPIADPGSRPQFYSPQRSEAERVRLYYLPLTKDAASVVSRFMWQELNELRVKTVTKAFQSLTSSPAAREAGLNPGEVLSILTPARRSMVRSLPSSPMETMAGLMVALAAMFKVTVETLALLAAPVEELSRVDDSGAVDDAGSFSRRPVSTTGGRGGPSKGSEVSLAPGVADEEMPGAPASAPTTAQLRARATVAASVCPQLVLLGDLSRSVGHGEAALVCASLMRDEARAVETLSDASQALRVGYGRFISDLADQLELAKKKRSARYSDGGEAGARRGTRNGEQSPAAENTRDNGFSSSSSSKLGRRCSGIGPAAVVAGMGAERGAMALVRLERFGGKCVSGLARGATVVDQ